MADPLESVKQQRIDKILEMANRTLEANRESQRTKTPEEIISGVRSAPPTPTPTPTPTPSPVSSEPVGAKPATQEETVLLEKAFGEAKIKQKGELKKYSAPKSGIVGTAMWDAVGKPIADTLYSTIGTQPFDYDPTKPEQAPVEQEEDLIKKLVVPGSKEFGDPSMLYATMIEKAKKYGNNSIIAQRREAREALANYIRREFSVDVTPNEAFDRYAEIEANALNEEKEAINKIKAAVSSTETSPENKVLYRIVDNEGKSVGSFPRPDQLTEEQRKLYRDAAIAGKSTPAGLITFTPPKNWDDVQNDLVGNRDSLKGHPKYKTVYNQFLPPETMINKKERWLPSFQKSDGTWVIDQNKYQNAYEMYSETVYMKKHPELGGLPSYSEAIKKLGSERYEKEIAAPAREDARNTLKKLSEYNNITAIYLKDPQGMARKIAAGEDPGYIESVLNLPGGIVSPTKYLKGLIENTPVGALGWMRESGKAGIPLPSPLVAPYLNSSNVLRSLMQKGWLSRDENGKLEMEWYEQFNPAVNGDFITWFDADFIDRNRAPYAAAMWGPNSGSYSAHNQYYGNRIDQQDRGVLEWVTNVIAPVGNVVLSYALNPDLKFGSEEHVAAQFDGFNYAGEYQKIGHAVNNLFGLGLAEDLGALDPETRKGLDSNLGAFYTGLIALLEVDALSSTMGLAKALKVPMTVGKSGRMTLTARQALAKKMAPILPTSAAKNRNSLDAVKSSIKKANDPETYPEWGPAEVYSHFQKAGDTEDAELLLNYMRQYAPEDTTGSTQKAFVNRYNELTRRSVENEKVIKEIEDQMIAEKDIVSPQVGDDVLIFKNGEFSDTNVYPVVEIIEGANVAVIRKKFRKAGKTGIELEQVPLSDVLRVVPDTADKLKRAYADQLLAKIEKARIDELTALSKINNAVELRKNINLALDATNTKVVKSRSGDAEYVTYKNQGEIAKLDKELDVAYQKVNDIRKEYGDTDLEALYVATSEAIEDIRKSLNGGKGSSYLDFYYGKAVDPEAPSPVLRQGAEAPLGGVPYYADKVKNLTSANAKLPKNYRYAVSKLKKDQTALENAVDTNFRILQKLQARPEAVVIPRAKPVFPNKLIQLSSNILSGKKYANQWLQRSLEGGSSARQRLVKAFKLENLSGFEQPGGLNLLMKKNGEFLRKEVPKGSTKKGAVEKLTVDDVLALFLKEWTATNTAKSTPGDITDGLVVLAKNFPKKSRGQLDKAINDYLDWAQNSPTIKLDPSHADEIKKIVLGTKSTRTTFNKSGILAELARVRKPTTRKPLVEHLGAGAINVQTARALAKERFASSKALKAELKEASSEVAKLEKKRNAALKKTGDSSEQLKKVLDEREQLFSSLDSVNRELLRRMGKLEDRKLADPETLTDADITGDWTARMTTDDLVKAFSNIHSRFKKNSLVYRHKFGQMGFAAALDQANASRNFRLAHQKLLNNLEENLPAPIAKSLKKQEKALQKRYDTLQKNKEELREFTGYRENFVDAATQLMGAKQAMLSRAEDAYIKTGKFDLSWQLPAKTQIVGGLADNIPKGSPLLDDLPAGTKADQFAQITPSTLFSELTRKYGDEAVAKELQRRGVEASVSREVSSGVFEGETFTPKVKPVDTPSPLLVELGRAMGLAPDNFPLSTIQTTPMRVDRRSLAQLEDLENTLFRQSQTEFMANSPERMAQFVRAMYEQPRPFLSGRGGVEEGRYYKRSGAPFHVAARNSLYRFGRQLAAAFDPKLALTGQMVSKEMTDVTTKMYNLQQKTLTEMHQIATGSDGINRALDWLTTQNPHSIETGVLQKVITGKTKLSAADVSSFNLVGGTPLERWSKRILYDPRVAKPIEETFDPALLARLDELVEKQTGSVKLDAAGEPYVVSKQKLTDAEKIELDGLMGQIAEVYTKQEAKTGALSKSKFDTSIQTLSKKQRKEFGIEDSEFIDRTNMRQSLAADTVALMWLPSGQKADKGYGILIRRLHQLTKEAQGKAIDEGRSLNLNDLTEIVDGLKKTTYALFGATDQKGKSYGFLVNGIVHGALEDDYINMVGKVVGPTFPEDVARNMNKWMNGFQTGDSVDFEKVMLGFNRWGMSAGYIDPKSGALAKEFRTMERAFTGMATVNNQMVKVAMEGDLARYGSMPESMLEAFESINRIGSKELAEISVQSPAAGMFTGRVMQWLKIWKIGAVMGLLSPRFNHFVNMAAGDWSQMVGERGFIDASKAQFGNSLMYFPGIGKPMQNFISDQIAKNGGKPWVSQLESMVNPWLADIFSGRGEKRLYKVKEGFRTGAELHREMTAAGVHSHIVSREMFETQEFVRRQLKKSFFDKLVGAGKYVALQPLGPFSKHVTKTNEFIYKNWSKHWANHLADIQTRQRGNAYLYARNNLGLDAAASKKYMEDMFYDWSTGVARWEALTVGRISAFHTFWRLSFGQFGRALIEPVVSSPTDLLKKAATGQTRLKRIVAQKRVLYDLVPAWLSEDETADDDEQTIYEAQLDVARNKQVNWAAGARGFLPSYELTPEEQLRQLSKTGRYVSHGSTPMPYFTGPDMMYIKSLFMGGITGMLATASGSKDVGMNPTMHSRMADQLADFLFPPVKDFIQGNARFAGQYTKYKLPPTSQKYLQTPGMRSIYLRGLNALGSPVFEENGEYYTYSGNKNFMVKLYDSTVLKYNPILSTDVPRMMNDLYIKNPYIDENGVADAWKYFGFLTKQQFLRTYFTDPEEERNRRGPDQAKRDPSLRQIKDKANK